MLLLLTIACAFEPASREPGPSALTFDGPDPHNVLMVSIDTLRRDRVGRYRQSGSLGPSDTPFLDQLLDEGVTLDDHRSCATWTYPSSACAVTGADIVAAGFAPQRREDETMPSLPEGFTTLAEQLYLHGYETGLLTANAFLGRYTHADRGHRISEVLGLAPASVIVDGGLEIWDALSRDGAPRPWFLHLHFMDPHLPFTPPEAYLSGLEGLEPVDYDLSEQPGYQEAATNWELMSEETHALLEATADVYYGGELRYLDDELRRLFDELEARGALDDTLVVLWSDHGEQFWDHGDVAHGNAVYAEENAAIAAFWAKGLTPKPWGGATTHEDIAPTVLTALGLDAPGVMDGVVVGGSDYARGPRYALSFGSLLEYTNQAVDMGGKRLIYHWRGDLELYDLREDPTEQRDLYAPGDPDVEALWGLLKPRVEMVEALTDDPSPVWPEL